MGLLERFMGMLSLPRLESVWSLSGAGMRPSSHRLASDCVYVSSRPSVRLRSRSFGSV